MTRPSPAVSVLVTTRDNERHIGTAIRSVLRQTFVDFELIVVDDGSRDSTPDVLETFTDPRLRVVHYETAAGICARRNELVGLARARYVAPLDADDVWMPKRLQHTVSHLDNDRRLTLVGSDAVVVDEGVGIGRYWRLPRLEAAIRWQCLFTSPVIHSAATIRASAFREGVRYDPAFPLAQDFDLCARLLERGGACNIGLPLIAYRVHREQASSRNPAAQRTEQEIIGHREIERYLEGTDESTGLAWSMGAGVSVDPRLLDEAVARYCELFSRFEERHRNDRGMGEARRLAAHPLLRRAISGVGARRKLWRAARTIDPHSPARVVAVTLGNRMRRSAHRLNASRSARC